MTHLDLFSGIGGFSLAAKWAGFETIGFSEIEPYACKILERHWPSVPNYGDIRNVPAIKCHLITGGPPCQPASCAGQRRGAADDRWLWPQTIECVERCRPAFCLFENPPGILSLNGGVEFERVLSGLEGLGYAVQPIIIPACAVDARHRRDRVWIVAYADELRARAGLESAGDHEAGLRSTTGIEQASLADAADDGFGRGKSLAQGSKGTGIMAHAESSRARAEEQFGQCREPQLHSRWPTEPELGRVAPRIPHRSHRLKGLGNAIVPQCAYQILRAIADSR